MVTNLNMYAVASSLISIHTTAKVVWIEMSDGLRRFSISIHTTAKVVTLGNNTNGKYAFISIHTTAKVVTGRNLEMQN